jgi:acyl-CoA synthetase (AMP-forming)/AMP-acid ligase II
MEPNLAAIVKGMNEALQSVVQRSGGPDDGSAMYVFQKHGWIAVALGMVIGCGAVLVLDAADQARTRSKLQQIADDAAIAGVLALASNGQRGTYVAQQQATVAATNQIESKIDRAGILVRPSSADSIVSVKVSAPSQSSLHALLHNGKPVTVIGMANYLPPAQPQEALENRLHGWRNYAQSGQE